jgi:uncharacterized cupredoxin-like copper-binding protein
MIVAERYAVGGLAVAAGPLSLLVTHITTAPRRLEDPTMHNFRFPLLVTLLLFGALAFTACGGDDDDDAAAPTAAATEAAGGDDHADSVEVTLTDFAIALSASEAHGDAPIEFVVANAGAAPHNFLIVETDLAADALPVESGAVDEGQVDVVGRIAQFDANSSQTETFSLDAGSYVLICNIPGHYQLGMTIAFTVE